MECEPTDHAKFSPRKTSSKRYCSVPQCSSEERRNPDLRFHSFPPEGEFVYVTNKLNIREKCDRRKTWVKALKIGKPLSKSMFVCSRHFVKSDYVLPDVPAKHRFLKKTAVPSLNLPITSCEVRHPHRNRNSGWKQRLREQDLGIPDAEGCEPAGGGVLGEFGNGLVPDAIEIGEGAVSDMPKNVGDAVEALLSLRDVTPLKCDAEVQNTVEMKDFCCQVSSGDFKTSFVDIIDTPPKLVTFAGIDSFLKLEVMLNILSSVIPDSTRGSLSLKSQVLLTCMKMKLNWSFTVLSVLFGVTPTTAKNVFTKILLMLTPVLKKCIVWPSKEEILRNIPTCFESFKRVRVVLDCTEVRMARFKCLKCRILSYSNYKGAHTVKFMVGVTPGGLISFVSNAYGGRASDKAIFEESGLIQLLEPHFDDIMVDKGFLIKNVCDKHYIGLVHPPFLRKAHQFSKADALATAKVARARVHVERVIERLKKFKILCDTIPAPLVHLVDDIMFYIAGMTNLSSPILAEDKFIIE